MGVASYYKETNSITIPESVTAVRERKKRMKRITLLALMAGSLIISFAAQQLTEKNIKGVCAGPC
jgi:hypothetical protein